MFGCASEGFSSTWFIVSFHCCRFGSFEIFLARDELSGLQGPSAGQHHIRAQLLDYVIETFHPDIQHGHRNRKDRNMAFFKEVRNLAHRMLPVV